jgi:hypothetical protein
VDAIYQRLKADGFDIKAPMSSTEAGHQSAGGVKEGVKFNYNIEHLTCDARVYLIWRPTAAQAGDSSSGSAAQKVVTRKECRGRPGQVAGYSWAARSTTHPRRRNLSFQPESH